MPRESSEADVLKAYLEGLDAPRKRISWRVVGRFIAIITGQSRLMTGSLVAMAIAVLGTLAGPRLLGLMVDEGLRRSDFSKLLSLSVLFLIIEIVRHGASMIQTYLLGSIGQRVMHDLRRQVFDRIMILPLARIDKISSGNLVSRITNDVAALSNMFSAGVIAIIEKLVVVVSIVAAMFVLDWYLAIVALALFTFLVAFAVLISMKLHAAYARSRAAIGAVTMYLTDTLAGMKVIKTTGMEDVQSERFEYLSGVLSRTQVRPNILSGMMHPAMTIITALSIALLIWFGGALVQSKTIEVGVLVTFFTYTLWIFWPIMHIVGQWNVIISGVASAERIFEVLDWPVEEGLAGTPPRLIDEIQGTIEFDRVWFSYRGDDDWILRDVSFKANAGEMVGLVGPTGAGKSTILALLLRFYEPQRGRILLDGVPLAEWPKPCLRQVFGVVRQDAVLWSGTIGENVVLGSSAISVHARSIAERELNRRGLSWDEVIGPGGRDLSAGEKQLLSFLRTLVRSPKIWILDEATAHLDPWLDQELERLIQEYAPGRTVLCVAHRLSSVRRASKIVVLADGAIAEQGPHGELVNRGQLYSRLFEVQARLQEGGR